MRTRKLMLKRGAEVLVMATLALAGNQALAAEYWLKAAQTTLADPNGGPAITVWGYVSCTASFAACESTTNPIRVPGPALTVPAIDDVLTVHLLNALAVPTSLVVNGLSKSMAPVLAEPAPSTTTYLGGRPTGNRTARVRSFDLEAAPGNIADYSWRGVQAGTYLYQSGTQPQVQVQMGLYGAVAKNAVDAVAGTTPVRAQAYPGIANEYDNQATLLYSEIDPALHTAVAAGTYGTPTGPTSTFNYAPKYFLINGKPYQFGSPVIEPVGGTGSTTLLRLLNAGLTTHVPMVQGKYWNLVAEDGKAYTYARNQYTALLPAAKTLDALLTPDVGATYAIMDRRLSLSNNGVSGGGMMAFLSFGPVTAMLAGGGGGGGGGGTNVAPVANDDPYDSITGVTLNVAAASGVLANDTDADSLLIKAVAASGSTAGGGTYTLSANGSFTYLPAAGFAGASDSFTYRATDGRALSNPATVMIALATPIAPTLSVLDDFSRVNANSLGATNWSQTASTTSAPNLQIDTNRAKAVGTDLGGQAIWKTEFLEKQGAGFNTVALPVNSALILKATGGTDAAPANFIRVRHEDTNEIVVATLMGGSNTALYVKQAAFAPGSGALSAVVDAKGLVTVFQGGAYLGGVQLPDVGVWKGRGRIGIQLQTDNATVDDFSGGNVR